MIEKSRKLMNKIKNLGITLSIIFTLTIVNIKAQTKNDSRNVLDYYKLIPNLELGFKRADSKITIKDTKNGYLEIDVANGRKKVQIALFWKTKRKPLLVFFKENKDIENFSSPNLIKAFELSDFAESDQMEDVSFDVLPSISNRENLALFNQKRKKTNSENRIYLFD